MIVVDCKVLHFINNEDHEALSYKTQTHINAVTSHRVYGLWVSVSVFDDF